MRKDMKLDVEQFIDIQVSADDYLSKLFASWKGFISKEVRAESLDMTASPQGKEVKSWDITGKEVVIGVTPL